MNKNLCTVVGCFNHGKYSRLCGHLQDEPKEQDLSMKEYLKVRAEYLKKHKTCQVKDCKEVAKEIHHKRGRLKNLLTNSLYFLAVCRKHHRQIEAMPHWAKEQGYSESRHKKHAI